MTGPAGSGAQHPRTGQSGVRRPGGGEIISGQSHCSERRDAAFAPTPPPQLLGAEDPEAQGEEEVTGVLGLPTPRCVGGWGLHPQL